MNAFQDKGINADMKPPLIVVITGAAGRIAYSLIPFICDGSTFGKETRIDLRLVDIEISMTKLQGLLMEIQDSNFDLLESASISSSPTAFKDADIAVLLGGYPRMPGMERKNLIEKNAEGMREQGLSLEKYASKNVKVLVVANPANTNMLVLIKTAKKIPSTNFSCLTRLDEERLRSLVAHKINTDLSNQQEGGTECRIVRAKDVSNVFIFGNHSTTQVPYIEMGTVVVNNQLQKVKSFFSNDETEEVISRIQNRGGEVIRKLGLSSGLSAAGAIVRHLRDVCSSGACCEDLGVSTHIFSCGVLSDGNPYGVPDGIVFSFPCCVQRGQVVVVPGMAINRAVADLLDVSAKELQGERGEAEAFLNSLPSPKL